MSDTANCPKHEPQALPEELWADTKKIMGDVRVSAQFVSRALDRPVPPQDLTIDEVTGIGWCSVCGNFALTWDVEWTSLAITRSDLPAALYAAKRLA